jgi:putative membrane protein
MMHWYGGGMGWWGAMGAVLVVALFWALVLGSVIVLVRYLVDGHISRRDMPLESTAPAAILAARFARGEISESEYRDRLAVLRETRRSTTP